MLRVASFALGWLFLLSGTIGCFMLAGNSPANLFYFVPSLAMFLLPMGCCSMAFGIRGPLVVLRSFAALWSSGPMGEKNSEAARIISASIGYVYGAGAFVFLASLLTITSGPSAADSLTVSFGRNAAPTIASLIYAVVLAELVLRPLKHRLETLER